MCLDYELTKKQADKIKSEARKRGYIRVYKVCAAKQTGTVGGIRGKWKKGISKAKYLRERNGGWYAFISHRGAKRYKIPHESIKTCYAKPSWIKRLGGYDFCGHAAIFTHLCFPDWDKGDMTIREFRAMCKEKP